MILTIDTCLRLAELKKRETNAAQVEVYCRIPEHIECTEDVNNDHLVQATNDRPRRRC